MEEKFIDVEKIIADKNPVLYKRMPKFIISYLKKILHQDEVNKTLYENRNLYGYDFCHEIIERFNLSVNAIGVENIPKQGGVIIAVNHPLGGMDAMAIIHAFSQIRSDIKFIANDVLLNLKNLKSLFIGVNKIGKHSPHNLQQVNNQYTRVNDLFKSDNAALVFPAGLVSRKKKGVVQDLKWKKTFISQSKKHNKPIIPVYLNGELSDFFYRLSNLRMALGIKANIEMLYLVNELYKQQNKTINISVGKLIPPETFDTSKTDYEWAQWVRNIVYSLDKNTFSNEKK
ncbi:MAG: 1-acyl-sn-glycerol-3-phosphate acyltransferase [Cyclobacteriaceae bacterium]|nr:1-acyl-sn-glycerol-3-phosphate acyltransferase [Cyclobacteriaceae bacterium]